MCDINSETNSIYVCQTEICETQILKNGIQIYIIQRVINSEETGL